MTTTFVVLRFTDTRGRQQVVYATMRDSGAWDVRGIVAGRPFSKECDGWQAVERTVSWLSRHTDEPVSPTQRHSGAVVAAIFLLMLLGG